jgi:hypothetical protein
MAASNESSSLKEDDPISQILFEPVLVIARLAQISMYPLGTKIFIRDNAIYIHPYSVIQPISRWMLGDSREDLTYLYEPIQRFAMIFKNKTSDTQKIVLLSIIEKAIQGLEKLRNTYGSYRTLDHSLAYYQSFLIQCLKPKERAVNYRTPLRKPITADTSEIPRLDLTDDEDEDSIPDFTKVSGLWTLDDIRMLRTMLNEAYESADEDEKGSRLKTLDSFLHSKEIEIKRIFKDCYRP